MHVTVQVRVDDLSDEQTVACLKNAFTDAVSIEQAVEDSIMSQRSASAIVYACHPTNESIALFSMLGGGVVGYVLEFVYSSNETLLALTEHTVEIIERQVKHSGGRFRFVKASLEDDSSLGTAVEAKPSGWLDRLCKHVEQRDLLIQLLVLVILAVLASALPDFRTGAAFVAVGVIVSLAASLVQAARDRKRVEWRIR